MSIVIIVWGEVKISPPKKDDRCHVVNFLWVFFVSKLLRSSVCSCCTNSARFDDDGNNGDTKMYWVANGISHFTSFPRRFHMSHKKQNGLTLH